MSGCCTGEPLVSHGGIRCLASTGWSANCPGVVESEPGPIDGWNVVGRPDAELNTFGMEWGWQATLTRACFASPNL